MSSSRGTRDEVVINSLVDLADTLVIDFDIIDLLSTMTRRCVDLLDVSAAGVMLASPDGELRVVASSSETMRLLELFELLAVEGPCLEAYRSGTNVEQAVFDEPDSRWPRFAREALDSGFASGVALPLRLRDQTVGALNLFRESATPITEADIRVARAFADLAAISVLQHRAAADARVLSDQLREALDSRVVIEQAKGILARDGVEVTEAFARLRRFARSNNVRLSDVASGVVTGTIEQLDPS